MNRVRIMTVALLVLGAVAMARAGSDTKAGDDYPLKTCVVSGDELTGAAGETSIVYQGQEVRFCCKDCIADFNKNPEKYLAKIKKAEAAAGGEHGDHGAAKAASGGHDHNAHGSSHK